MKGAWASMAAIVASATVAATPSVAPSAGSDAILSLHRPEGVLVLRYRQETPAGQSQEVSVGIAADYHYIQSPGQLSIYDYRLKRVFSVRGTTFVDNSLYADVWRRRVQLTIRIARSQLEPRKPNVPSGDETRAFWDETEFGMTATGLPLPQLTATSNFPDEQWTLRGIPVAKVRYRIEAVPLQIRGGLRRFWSTFAEMHPVIATTLAQSGRMPAELWLSETPSTKPNGMVHWTLLDAHWDSAARFPLPPHLEARPATGIGLYPKVFATLAARIDHRVAPPTQETYTLRSEAAIWRGRGLEAELWLIEMNLARGAPAECQPGDTSAYCKLSIQAESLAQSDPRTSTAFGANPPSEQERSRFRDLPNLYVLQLLWARLPPGPGAAGPTWESDLLAALDASPVANFCKDAGILYLSQGRPFAAWQTWDFGRSMAGHVPGDLLDSVDVLEADLAAKEPAFF